MDATGGREQCRVRVWFGTYPIADYTADVELAKQYEDAMRQRFGSLRVTSERLLEHTPPEPAGPAPTPVCGLLTRSGAGPASETGGADVLRSGPASAPSYQPDHSKRCSQHVEE